ncbi:hypothetical protein FQN54_005813 [Arachnomyces sp. PD_36]|nr:hypothetical protein FQN54_005813 [Arachnomyces sp. PD_36]
MAPSSNSSNSSSDSLLAAAFEESIRIQRLQEHADRELELDRIETEERVLEESRRTFLNRALEVENEDEAEMRLAMERSAADERERVARREREREERARLDRDFGSGGSRSQRHRERYGSSHARHRGSNEDVPGSAGSGASRQTQRDQRRQCTAPHHGSDSPPSSSSQDNTPQARVPHVSGRRQRDVDQILDTLIEEEAAEEAIRNMGHRHHLEPRAQYQQPGQGQFQERRSRAAEGSRHYPRQGRSHAAVQRENNQSSRSGLEAAHEQMSMGERPRRTNSDRSGMGTQADPTPGRHRHNNRRHQQPNQTSRGSRNGSPGPSSYSLSEILSRSRADAYPTHAPFTEAGLEFNHHELQAAINASAEQGRDPDEEAVERNRDCPTYEEACEMARYKPRRGDRYVFQGPNSVTIEGDEEENKPNVRLEIVGEMDLVDAMRVANRGRNRNGTNPTDI